MATAAGSKRTLSRTPPELRAALGELDRDLAAYAATHGGRFTLFGSARRGEMDEASDVDVLVDFPTERSGPAEDFAEKRAYALGLRPDIHLRSWSPPKLLREVERDEAGEPMTDDRGWSLALDAADSASRHFGEASDLYRDGSISLGGREGYRALMAFFHAMQSGHTSAESALRRALRIAGDHIPTGEKWHEALIALCATPMEGRRPAILPPDLAAHADETRKFRHRAMHGYDAEFAMERADIAVQSAAELARSLRPALERFRAELDAAR